MAVNANVIIAETYADLRKEIGSEVRKIKS